jgi:hypothetical protein
MSKGVPSEVNEVLNCAKQQETLNELLHHQVPAESSTAKVIFEEIVS